MRLRRISDNGFTIIELMIATVVFSVILLVMTIGLLQIGRAYYKGVNSTKVQEASRAVADQVGQAIQFSGSASLTPSDTQLCTGNLSLRYVLNKPVKEVAGQHALISRSGDACLDASTAFDPALDTELLGENMRLADLYVESLGDGLYKVTVRVVYGEDDLLCNAKVTDECNKSVSAAPTFDTNDRLNNDIKCKNIRSGTQYCAVSEVSTIVQKRVY